MLIPYLKISLLNRGFNNTFVLALGCSVRRSYRKPFECRKFTPLRLAYVFSINFGAWIKVSELERFYDDYYSVRQ